MDSTHLKYLRNINKHVGGPLKTGAQDNNTARALFAVSGVLSRVIVNAEAQSQRLEQLKASVKKWRAEFLRLLPAGGEGGQLVNELGGLVDSAASDLHAIEKCLAQIAGYLGRQKSADAQALLREIVEQEYLTAQALEKDFQALVSDMSLQGGETAQTGLTDDERQKLIKLLQQQCGESDQLGIVGVNVNPGGLSKRTIFVQLKNNQVLPQQIVLRQDLASSPLGTTVVDEFPLLKVLHEAGVKVPQPLALDAEGAVVGSPLLVVNRAAGSVVGDGINIFDKQGRDGCALALAREMAKYHAIPIERLPDSVSGKNKSNIETMRADIEVLRKKWDESSATSIVIDAAFAWLFDHLDYAGEQRSLVHGDLRFHNLLVEGGDVVALLDWEIAMVSNPGFDLGYVYQDIVQLMDWQKFLDAYAAAGGVVPPQETIDFYQIRTELFIAVNMSRMEDGFLAGAFDNVLAVYGSISFPQHCRYRLAERLHAALSRVK